jgi:hypothetical protein
VTTDLDDNPRPQGCGFDLGAYENQSAPGCVLAVAAAGNGTGSVTPTLGSHVYNYGTTVWLTATANTGSTFAGWSGTLSGMTNPISITLDANKAVTATFTLACTSVSGADLIFAPAAPKVGQAVTFAGTVTAGTTPITYTWSFGDGGIGSGVVVSHTFPITTMSRTYGVTLTASNACSTPAVQRLITIRPYTVYLPIMFRN